MRSLWWLLLLTAALAALRVATGGMAQNASVTVAPSAPVAWRAGWGADYASLVEFPPAAADLGAGWYYDWQVRADPPRPGGIEYVQLINLHQRLTCPEATTSDRALCPYASPPAYDLQHPLASYQEAARANPGSTWLLGNEIDVMDGPGYMQNEMLPELYAVAYHDLYSLLKEADPTAIVAPAGVAQFTPLRRSYLNRVLATYRRLYGARMPVDLWNIHGYVLPELCRVEEGERVCYGAGVPPGSPALSGAYVGEEWRHTDLATFQEQLLAFRTWLDARGYADVPILLSEYGVLLNTVDDATVHQFLLETFDWLASDNLVQRWAWFVLADTGDGFHPAGALVDANGLTETGRVFADFVHARADDLERPEPGVMP